MRRLRERSRVTRPMLAGRPLEPVGNGGPRWMVATEVQYGFRYRIRLTCRLVRLTFTDLPGVAPPLMIFLATIYPLGRQWRGIR